MSLPSPFSAALRLAIFSFVIIGLVSLVFNHTKDKIKHNQYQALVQRLQTVLVAETYNNDLTKDSILLQGFIIYRAYHSGQPVAAIFKSTTAHGYSGDIQILTAISIAGKLIAVRILNHQETAGLGDKIELKKSNWLLSFQDKTLADMQSNQWAVKRDQGSFDQFTGATITPRAVVNEVKKIGLFFQQHKSEIFPSLN